MLDVSSPPSSCFTAAGVPLALPRLPCSVTYFTTPLSHFILLTLICDFCVLAAGSRSYIMWCYHKYISIKVRFAYQGVCWLHHRLISIANILNMKGRKHYLHILKIWMRQYCYSWLHDLSAITCVCPCVCTVYGSVRVAAGRKAMASRLIFSMHPDRLTHAHMYSMHAPCFSPAEWQHDYCIQSLHYSTAL